MTSDLSGDGCGDLVEDNIVIDDDGARTEGLYLHPVEGGGQGGVLVQRRQLQGVKTLKAQAGVAIWRMSCWMAKARWLASAALRFRIQTSLSYKELKH